MSEDKGKLPIDGSETELSDETIESEAGIYSLGIISSKFLKKFGMVSLFINSDGLVEWCLPGEMELDALPEDEALTRLLETGYTDEGLQTYLRGRDARNKLRQVKAKV